MMRIDAHQHFWQFDPERDAWITEEMAAIRKDFLPGNLFPLLKGHSFDGCVAVQADQSEEQNTFLLELAAGNDFIKGIVGWVDLRSSNVEATLERYASFPLIKGFRHVLQGEAQRDLMVQSDFKKGISYLNKYGFSYDILIFPDQLKYIPEFVEAFPDQRFVIDHLAKPFIAKGELQPWKKDIESIATYPNVFCKISGMVTEADWKHWKKEDFVPYLDTIIEAFGPYRLMFGSDWPVVEVAGGYTRALELVNGYMTKLSDDEQSAFWGGNAVQFYKLK